MNKFVIYHNPRCSKSRQALQLLQDHNVNVKVIEYLKNPPTAKALSLLLTQLNLEPRELMRKNEPIYKELNLSNPHLTKQELIQAMVENPILIERPIVITQDRVIIARPPEKLLELL